MCILPVARQQIPPNKNCSICMHAKKQSGSISPSLSFFLYLCLSLFVLSASLLLKCFIFIVRWLNCSLGRVVRCLTVAKVECLLKNGDRRPNDSQSVAHNKAHFHSRVVNFQASQAVKNTRKKETENKTKCAKEQRTSSPALAISRSQCAKYVNGKLF